MYSVYLERTIHYCHITHYTSLHEGAGRHPVVHYLVHQEGSLHGDDALPRHVLGLGVPRALQHVVEVLHREAASHHLQPPASTLTMHSWQWHWHEGSAEVSTVWWWGGPGYTRASASCNHIMQRPAKCSSRSIQFHNWFSQKRRRSLLGPTSASAITSITHLDVELCPDLALALPDVS